MTVRTRQASQKEWVWRKQTAITLCFRILEIGRVLFLISCAGTVAGVSLAQGTQGPSSNIAAQQTKKRPGTPGYVRPKFRQRFDNSLRTTFGPLQMVTLALGSGLSQAHNVPPEWGQGWGAYGKRFVSDVGSSTSAGAANFLLGEALDLDTEYYPCTCKAILPRLEHALLGSVTAHDGIDGVRVFSFPAITSPYAGAFSTLAWYPSRYGPKDALRTGSYDFLDSVGMKITLEFLHPVFRKLHL